MTNQERIEELAPLNAAGALDLTERDEFERLLATADPAVLSRVAQFQELAALLALALSAAPELPRGLKEKIMRRVAVNSPAAAPGSAGQHSAALATPGFTFIAGDGQGNWLPLKVPGAWVKLLSLDAQRGYAVVLGKLDAGARYPAHQHIHAEQIYVLTGDLHIGDHRLGAGDFHQADAGSEHGVNHSETGCTILAVLSTADLAAQMV